MYLQWSGKTIKNKTLITKTSRSARRSYYKAVFCINECKVLLYLFNNKLIIEKKKNYAIIKS